MLDKVLKAISQFNMLNGVTEVTVALSGGADSMALLNALYELKDELKISLSAAHFNHKIRGEEADRDEAFVKAECQKLGIPIFCDSADVPKYAQNNNMSLELAARELRYSFLSSVAKGAVATAHTASDNLETMLFNLTRGTGIKGLCGIPAKREIFIRPLIFCTRNDIEAFCESRSINYVTDSTNLCDEYTRNKIRHNIIPTIKEINSSAESAAIKAAVSLFEDNDFLQKTAEKEFSSRLGENFLDISNISKLHPAIAKRVIKGYYELCCSINADNIHILQMYEICIRGGKISLPDDMSAVAENGKLKFECARKKLYDTEFSVDIKQSVNDLFVNSKKVNNLLLKNTIDCDKIIGKSVLRARTSGDSMRIAGCTKTLKKLYTEFSVPLEDRKNLPVISDDEGVIWICGIGVSDRVKVTDKSQYILKINAVKISENKGE